MADGGGYLGVHQPGPSSAIVVTEDTSPDAPVLSEEVTHEAVLSPLTLELQPMKGLEDEWGQEAGWGEGRWGGIWSTWNVHEGTVRGVTGRRETPAPDMLQFHRKS